jgi:hypothetical protein
MRLPLDADVVDFENSRKDGQGNGWRHRFVLSGHHRRRSASIPVTGDTAIFSHQAGNADTARPLRSMWQGGSIVFPYGLAI